MLRIGVLSDTHGDIHPKVFDFFKEVDQIWHAGDIGSRAVLDQLASFKPVYAVFGNIDGQDIRARIPEYQYFTCEKAKVMMTHIGGYPGHYPPHIKSILKTKKPHIFVSGHSHILRVMFDKTFQCLYINPGAAGNHGFHKNITFLRFIIDGDQFKDMEIMDIPR